MIDKRTWKYLKHSLNIKTKKIDIYIVFSDSKEEIFTFDYSKKEATKIDAIKMIEYFSGLNINNLNNGSI